MQIKIRFFTNLREIVGKREETLSFSADVKVSVKIALKVLAEKYGKSFQEYVFNNQTEVPKAFLQFLINGTSTSTLNGLETVLKDGDVLAILPPVGGG